MQTIKNIMGKKGTEMTAGEALIYSGFAMVTVYGVIAVVGSSGICRLQTDRHNSEKDCT